MMSNYMFGVVERLDANFIMLRCTMHQSESVNGVTQQEDGERSGASEQLSQLQIIHCYKVKRINIAELYTRDDFVIYRI